MFIHPIEKQCRPLGGFLPQAARIFCIIHSPQNGHVRIFELSTNAKARRFESFDFYRWGLIEPRRGYYHPIKERQIYMRHHQKAEDQALNLIWLSKDYENDQCEIFKEGIEIRGRLVTSLSQLNQNQYPFEPILYFQIQMLGQKNSDQLQINIQLSSKMLKPQQFTFYQDTSALAELLYTNQNYSLQQLIYVTINFSMESTDIDKPKINGVYISFISQQVSYFINMYSLNKVCQRFSTLLSVPVIDIKPFLTESGNYMQDCKGVASALHKYGCLIIKDPRVNVDQNNKFIDMMELFFQNRSVQFYAGRPVPDIFPELAYQVGATPQFAEKAKDNKEISGAFKGDNKAATPSPPPFDAKWRYFWNIGDVMEDIAQNKPPTDFPAFKGTAEGWGGNMINGCYTVAEMAAVGMGFDRYLFTEMMKRGPHKLAPTGSDLTRYKVGTIFAGLHYDFNFLTIHGKSRYPGLFAWLRSGQKFQVSVPQGHLLLQAGKQFEWLTGGYINCGYHEVVYTQQVEDRKNKAIKQGKIPWRISSTLFSHIRGDVVLEPLAKFKTPQSLKNYPPILAQEHANQQLQAISLKK